MENKDIPPEPETPEKDEEEDEEIEEEAMDGEAELEETTQEDLEESIETEEEMEDSEEDFEEGEEPPEVDEISAEDSEEEGEELDDEAARIAAMEEEKRKLLESVDDLEDLSLDDIEDMKEAIEENVDYDQEIEQEWKPEEITADLQARIEAELARKKEEEEEEEEVMDAEKLTKYLDRSRDKVWYHALHFLVFNVDDHTLTKEALYDQLKEVTSSSPVDPIAQQVFYFGLSPLLRLKLYDNNVLRYGFTGFKVAVNIDNLQKILEEVGEPISRRPVIEKEEEMEMIKGFLDDDFLDI